MQPDHQAPHILVTNHSPEILDLIRELLEEEGYRVTTHARAGERLDDVVEVAPNLIIIDYMWPHSDNEWTLLNLLRIDRRTRHTPVILCTGAVQHVREMEDYLQTLNIRVVYKPFNIDDLLLEVVAALEGTEPQRAHPISPSG